MTKSAAAGRFQVIQIVHGMAEYIDRYDDLHGTWSVAVLSYAPKTISAMADLRHEPSDYGHMPVKGGKDILIADVHELRKLVSALYPGVPYVLYGHSMGSFIVRAYIARYGDELSACVLSGTGNVPAPLSKAGRTWRGSWPPCGARRHRSPLIDGMGAGGYGKQIANARTHLDWLSTDDAVVDAYMADDRCGFMFTVGGYATLLDLTAEVVTPECAARCPRTCRCCTLPATATRLATWARA